MITKSEFQQGLNKKANEDFHRITRTVSSNLDNGIKVSEFKANEFATSWDTLSRRLLRHVMEFGWTVSISDFTKTEGEMRDPYEVAYKRVTLL